MKSMLALVPLIVMFTIVPTIFALSCKFSAFMLRRRVVYWKHCFTVAYILLLMSIAINAIINLSGLIIHPSIIIVIALIVQLGVGSWFLSQRASYSNGQKVGFRGGTEIIFLTLAIVAGIALFLMTLGNYLRTFQPV